MRRCGVLLTLLMAVTVSCSVGLETEDPSGNTAKLALRLEISPSAKIVETGPDECAVGSVRVLEFNSKGDILQNSTFPEGGDIRFPIQKDHQLDIYLVANYGTVNLDDVSSKTDFLSRQVSYDDMGDAHMTMLGHLSGSFSNDSTVNVKMERLVAKFVLDTITFKISNGIHDYYRVAPHKAYMEKTPLTVSFGLLPADAYVNADKSGMGDWGWANHGGGTCNEYTEGDYEVWEWLGQRTVYALPNLCEDNYGRSVMTLEYNESYIINESYGDGEWHPASHMAERTLKLVLPSVRPNTLYELKKIVVRGDWNRSIVLASGQRTPEETGCEFLLSDLTTGEIIGTEKGEVWYEIQDN